MKKYKFVFHCYEDGYSPVNFIKNFDKNKAVLRNTSKTLVVEASGIKLYAAYPELPQVHQYEIDAANENDCDIPTYDYIGLKKIVSQGRISNADICFVVTGDCSMKDVLVITFKVDDDNEYCNNDNYEKKERKEEKNMRNLFNNVKCGKIKDGSYAISMYGTIAYNGKTYVNGEILNVEDMIMDFDMLYFMPTTSVKPNDIIEVNCVPYVVLEETNTGLRVINLRETKEEKIAPTSTFGVKLYSKVVNPMQMMSQNGGSNLFDIQNNPMMTIMMMKAMSKDGDSDNIMKIMLMTQVMPQLANAFKPVEVKSEEQGQENIKK